MHNCYFDEEFSLSHFFFKLHLIKIAQEFRSQTKVTLNLTTDFDSIYVCKKHKYELIGKIEYISENRIYKMLTLNVNFVINNIISYEEKEYDCKRNVTKKHRFYQI